MEAQREQHEINREDVAKFAFGIINQLIDAEQASGQDIGQCPRASVKCIVLDKHATLLGTGSNTLPDCLGECTCNTDDADTMVRGSNTCRAVHAEVNAVMEAARNGFSPDEIYYVVSTRPPCKNCLSVLMKTSAVFIVAPDNYPDRDSSMNSWRNAGRHWFTIPRTLLD